MAKRNTVKMSEEEKRNWKELCEYVKIKILGYDESQKIPKILVYRLKGLSEGNFIANRNIEKQANYSFKTILNTFKVCRLNIISAFSKNTFKDETHRINYMMVIIENKINDVYLREKRLLETNNKIQNLDLKIQSEITHTKTNYKPKTKLKKSIDDLL